MGTTMHFIWRSHCVVFSIFDKSMIDGSMDGRMVGRTDGWMDGWMDGQTDGRMNRRSNRPTDGWTKPLIEMRGRI